MSGTITLYYKGEPIRARRYKTSRVRTEILALWELEFKARYKEMYYQISPDIHMIDLNEIKLTA